MLSLINDILPNILSSDRIQICHMYPQWQDPVCTHGKRHHYIITKKLFSCLNLFHFQYDLLIF